MNRFTLVFFVLLSVCVFFACGKIESKSENQSTNTNVESLPINTPVPPPTPKPTQITSSPIGRFDFKNYTYPLPRGWQGTMDEIKIENGIAPLSIKDSEREEEGRIGARYVGVKFGEVTGDGQDEAFVVVKIETGGAALPQIAYIFEWKNEQPELIWYFRTGDRSDGGLRDIRAENGELVVELYGQDRYIFGDVETMKITGDEEQLCCPNYFTRSRYKLTGTRFVLQGKRQTFSIADPNASPIENMGEVQTVKRKK